jgi:hypothetical protein
MNMTKAFPIELPFGFTLRACHGLPMLVVGLAVAACAFLMVATVSRLLPPVTLTTIQIVPSEISSTAVLDRAPVKLAKTGVWKRLCPSYAVETVYDKDGFEVGHGGEHRIDVPTVTGPIEHAPRPVMIPKILGTAPGIYNLRLEVYSVCFPWESIWPIDSTSAEATFQIIRNPGLTAPQ